MNRDLKMVIAGSGMTNYQVELKAGIPLTKLSRIIHGAIQPSGEEKESIARVLGVPMDSVFTSDPVPA